MTEAEIAWLAGLLEGEGTFTWKKQKRYQYPMVKVGSTDRDIIDRVREMWGGPVPEFHRRRRAHWKDQWIVARVGQPAVVVMQQVLPYMGERRAAKIQEILSRWEEHGSRKPVVEGISIHE